MRTLLAFVLGLGTCGYLQGTQKNLGNVSELSVKIDREVPSKVQEKSHEKNQKKIRRHKIDVSAEDAATERLLNQEK